MGQLSGKFALVTGGSRGIGAAICRHLAREGAHVLVNYAKSKDAADKVVADIKASGGAATVIAGDVGSPEAVAGLFKEVDKAAGGKLDILVNNAGVFDPRPLPQDTIENFDRHFSTNVRGVFLVTHAAQTRLRDGGRIINISSILGEVAISPGMAVYAATKFAVNGLTRGWARDLAPRNITVNAVMPGPIDTDMNPAAGDHSDGMRSMVPLGRYGTADEVAAVVAFLASPAASYVTAATIATGGGIAS